MDPLNDRESNADDRPGAVCPHCGASNRPHERVCSVCGRARDTSRAVPAADPGRTTERRQITVAFCDLVNSTALAADADPEDFNEIVRTFHRAVTRAMNDHGGFVARYMGDGALVCFGYPQAHEDDAEQAVHAALAAVEAVSALEIAGVRRLQTHIGIATGLVVVGDLVGMGKVHSPDIAGATPNLAARLQGIAPPDSIFVAETTRRLAGEGFEWRDVGFVAVKGIADPIRAWQVVGTRPVSSRFEAQHPSALSPLIGRERESAKLRELWQRAKGGEGQVVVITGEPGIGKSRLTADLMDALRAEPHAKLRYFCSPHREHSPLHPCIQQLEHAAGFTREDTPARKLDKLETALADVPQQDLQLIAELLLLPTADRFPVLQFAPQKRRERVLQALVDLLERLSRNEPLLSIFEDAQWCDETSRELLALAAVRVARLPVMLIVTARPEFDLPWAGLANVTRLSLVPLRNDQSAELIDWLAAGNALQRGVVDDIVARADGVPLFLEELTRAVIEQRETEKPQAVHERVGVPWSLQASLLARLDRLGGVREIAEVAAAIGRDFSVELLERVADRPHDEIDRAVQQLVESGLVVPRASFGAGYAGYSFRHALIRDAAYGLMVRDRRRPLNARIAQALESHFPERAMAQPEIVAHYCSEGGLTAKAVGYWLAAGQQALRRSAMSEALVFLRRGLELLRELPDDATRRARELDLTIALGKAQIATQGYAVASTGETFARARVLCEQLGDPPQLISVLHGLWTHALMRAEMESAKRQALALLSRGEERADPLWLLMGCRFSGVTHHPLGAFGEARAFLERGIALYDPAQFATYSLITVDDPKVVMLTYLSWSLMCMGAFDEAKRCSAQGLEFARKLGHAYTLAHALNGSSFVALTIETPKLALARLDELMPLLEEHGIAYYGAVGTLFRGYCLAALGESNDARTLLVRGMVAYRATGTGLYLPGFLRMSAEAFGRIGQADVAAECLREAMSAMEATSQRWDEAEMHRVHASLLLARGERESAVAELQCALDIACAQGAGLWELRAATDLARILAERGARGDAHDLLAAVCARFDVQNDAPDVVVARALLASIR